MWHEDRATVAAHFRRFRFYAIYQVLLYAKYRHESSGRRFVIDGYPARRAWKALRATPRALGGLVRGDVSSAARVLLQLVEASAVVVGELEGAIDTGSPTSDQTEERPMGTQLPIAWSTERQPTRRGVLWLGLTCDVSSATTSWSPATRRHGCRCLR